MPKPISDKLDCEFNNDEKHTDGWRQTAEETNYDIPFRAGLR